MVPNPPHDMPRVTPHLFYDDVAAAIDWLVKAFGFTVRLRMTDKDGAVVHGDLEMAESLVMVGMASEGAGRASPLSLGNKVSQRLYVFVDDVDAHYQRALSAGAKVMGEPKEQFYGDRVYEAEDLEGHRWKFAQHVRDVDSRTLKRPS